MPNTKSEGPTKATGRALSFALMLTLMAKGYPEMPVATLVNLLHITPDDANAIADGVLPSPEAVEKVCRFISDNSTKDSEEPVIQYEIEPWPVMNFSFRRAPHATRI